VTELVAPEQIPGKNREERAANAQSYLLQALEGYTKCGILAGKMLHAIDDQRLYSELGFNSFGEYLVSPEIDMRKDTAYRLCRVYRKFCEEGGLSLDEVAGISISKLDVGQRYFEHCQANELVEWCREMTRQDLKVFLAEKFNKGVPKEKAKRQVTCPVCNSEFVP
jgi:hypothetical protein